MSEIKLKSKLLKNCDYSSVDISSYIVPLHVDQALLEQDVLKFRKKYACKKEVMEVAKSDVVTLSCNSKNPRFQKEHMTIRVGLGLFSKDLESQIIGLHCFNKQEFIVGEDQVTVKIEGITRDIIPELTDELVLQSGLPEVKTVEDIYRKYRYEQYDNLLEKPADEAFSYVAGQVIQNSGFELDEEERISAVNIMIHLLADSSLLQGKKLSDITEEEFSGLFGVSRKELTESMKETGTAALKSAVLGQYILAQRKKLLQVTDYEAYLNKYANAVLRPVEEIRKEHPLMEYMINTYSEFYMDELEQYVFKKLKELGE